MFAFQCLNCKNLEPAGAAGDNDVPRACHICGHGVSFDPVSGIKTDHPENWLVLHQLPADELQPILDFFSISKKDIEKPTSVAAE